MMLENAPQYHTRMMRQIVEMIDGLTLKFLPSATPEISAIEPCWRELRRKVLDVPHTNLTMLRKAIVRHTSYAKSNLDVETFLYRILQGST